MKSTVITKEIRNEDIDKFERIATELRDLVEHIRSYSPEANLYVAETHLYLCNEPPHDDHCKANFNSVVSDVYIPSIDGGGW